MLLRGGRVQELHVRVREGQGPEGERVEEQVRDEVGQGERARADGRGARAICCNDYNVSQHAMI